MPRQVTEYLQRRGIQGPWSVTGTQRRDFSGAIVIPAFAESADLFKTLESLSIASPPAERALLTLVVVNHPERSSSAIQADNLCTLTQLATFARQNPQFPLAWIDAASRGLELPADHAGVGMARKLGFDFALNHLNWQAGDPILVSLDADTLVSENYQLGLLHHFQNCRSGGAVIPFCHRAGLDCAQDAAITSYELYLRGHVLGLRLAGSPYAFHTVGSALACRGTAYLQCGGMNRRQAGEDFYFLQQLAKTVGISHVKGIEVFPSPRPSSRVPFGTGPSVSRHINGDEQAILCYPLTSYRILADWLQIVTANPCIAGTALLKLSGNIHPELSKFLEANRLLEVWPKLQRNHPTRELFLKAFHTWFDGLKTLRLIHHLCATICSKGSPEIILPDLLRWAGLPVSPTPTQQLHLLRTVQNQGV